LYGYRLDATLACGSDQLCAGLRAEIEGAIHAIYELFEIHQDQPTGWGALLVDAFNSLNHSAMLLHAACFGLIVLVFFLMCMKAGLCWF